MKKIYQKPVVMVVFVNTQKMIAASGDQGIAIRNDYSGGAIQSRGSNDWEDDDEE